MYGVPAWHCDRDALVIDTTNFANKRTVRGSGSEVFDKHTRSKTAGDQGHSREIGWPVSLLGLLFGLIQAQTKKLRQKQTQMATREDH